MTRKSNRRTDLYGVNNVEVLQFLADLRTLHETRASEVWAGKLAIDPITYAVAQHVASTEGRAAREAEWLHARETASEIVRGRLGDLALRSDVRDAAADTAGAIVVRDLIPQTDFDVLVQPWARRSDPAADAPVERALGAVGAGTVALTEASGGRAPSVPEARVRGRVRPARAGAALVAATPAAVAIIALVAGVMLALNGTLLEAIGLGSTNAPSSKAPVLVGAASPFASGLTVASPAGSRPAAPPTSRTSPGKSTPAPAPRSTLIPIPLPTSVPQPTVAPTATPVPSSSPPTYCTVISLIGINTTNAQQAWSNAGFSGTVTFVPAVPPQFKIAFQSRFIGSSALCTSGITVRRVAP